MSNFTYSDELYHHGIKGQRWGIRRYQNEDGTLTEEGRARYGKELKRLQAAEEKASLESNALYKKKFLRPFKTPIGDFFIDRKLKRIGDAHKLSHNEKQQRVREMLQDDSLQTSIKKMNSLYEDYKKFSSDKELQNKYKELAAIVQYNRNNWGLTKDEIRDGYLYYDFDQGGMTSYDLYLLDNHKSPHDLSKKQNAAYEEFMDKAEDVVKKYTGDYYAKDIHWGDTTHSRLAIDMSWENTRINDLYGHSEMKKSEEKQYYNDLQKAKREYNSTHK